MPPDDMQPASKIHSLSDYREKRGGGDSGDMPVRQEFEFNDVGAAKRFAKMFGGEVRFIADINEWFFFQRTDAGGGRWMRDNICETDRMMKAMVASIRDEEQPKDWPSGPNAPEFWKERDGFYDRIVGGTRSNRLAAIKNQVKSELEPAQQGDFDKDIWLLNLLNGTYDLEKMEFRPAKPEDFITKQANVTFDPEAKLHYSPACPMCREESAPISDSKLEITDEELERLVAEHQQHGLSTWLKALYTYFTNYSPDEREELIKFLQRMLGYTMCGATSERFIFILQGKPDAGKSTIIKTMQRLLADYAARVPMDSLMESKVRDGERATPMLMRLMGARFVSALESDESNKLADAKIKELVGGDRLIGRDMHAKGRGIEFEPTHKLVIGTNYMPQIKDPIVWRKIKRIHFNHSIPKGEQIPKEQLEAAIEAKFSGLFNWLLEGFREWRTHGLGSCAVVELSTKESQIEQDELGQFLEDERWQRSGMISKAAFLTQFNAWAASELGWKHDISAKKLGMLMQAREFSEVLPIPVIDGKKTRSWRDLSLKDGHSLSTQPSVVQKNVGAEFKDGMF